MHCHAHKKNLKRCSWYIAKQGDKQRIREIPFENKLNPERFYKNKV